jgi:phosphopantetheinyl transferase
MPAITLLPTRMPEAHLRHLAGLLDAQERNRLARLRRSEDKRRYIVAHAGLRWLLAERLRVTPSSLRFVRGEHGKPELADAHVHGVHFNLSHASELAAVAICDHPVGIDIEHLDATLDPATADLVFTEEEKRRCRTHADHLRTWTAKEAVVKACGLGMNLPLRHFSVGLSTNTFQPITCHEPVADLETLMVTNFDALPGYYGGISVQSAAKPILIRIVDLIKAIPP